MSETTWAERDAAENDRQDDIAELRARCDARCDALSRESKRLHGAAKDAMHDHVHRIDGKFAQQRRDIDILAARDTRLLVCLVALTLAVAHGFGRRP